MLFYCLFQYFEEKEYQTESKRNETFGSVIFWKNMILETWSSCQMILEEATREVVAPPLQGGGLLSRGPLEHLPTDFFRLYSPTYPKNIHREDRSGVPPSQASVTTKNLSGARFRHPAGGGFDHEGLLHQFIALPMKRE